MELYLSFMEPHRIRYIASDGTVVHDEHIEVKYEFATIEGSIQLQSDVKQRDLIDWFDVDVTWSDINRRTDTYGRIRGLGTIQRMKLWQDRYSGSHYLTFYANQRRRWREYLLDDFDSSMRHRDDRNRRIQLGARGWRDNASESNHSHGENRERRLSTSIFSRSNRNTSLGIGSGSSSSAAPSSLDIRYLGIQFSRNLNIPAGTDGGKYRSRPLGSRSKLILSFKDYRRFIARWLATHATTAEFDTTVTYPTNQVELLSPPVKDHHRSGGPYADSLIQAVKAFSMNLSSSVELPSPPVKDSHHSGGPDADSPIQRIPVKAFPTTLSSFVDYLVDTLPLPLWELQVPQIPSGKGRVRWKCVRIFLFSLLAWASVLLTRDRNVVPISTMTSPS
jgi:hypothetical protein